MIAGVLTTLLALRPLGTVRLLRRYALVAVVIAAGYLASSSPATRCRTGTRAPGPASGSPTDVVIAVAVSWVPLAADYSRHSRSARSAFGGSFLGFTITQVACYSLGLLAFSTVASADGDTQGNLFSGFLAVPLGWLPFAVLVLRELDESFTNVYSTAVSVQNLRPLADRRVLAVVVGGLATVGGAGPRHRRLPELPVPARLGVRADVRGLRRRLLPARRPGPLEHRRRRPEPLRRC